MIGAHNLNAKYTMLLRSGIHSNESNDCGCKGRCLVGFVNRSAYVMGKQGNYFNIYIIKSSGDGREVGGVW